MSNSIDDLLSGGAAGKGMKFKTVGDSYTGIVVSAEPRAYTDLQTGKPEFWDDGNPKMQAVIGIQTDERDPAIENDDGVRYDYIKMWGKQKQAFRAAAQAAGGSPAPGDTYSVRFVGEEPSKTRGFNPTKLYEYKVVKANPIDAALNTGPAIQQQFAQQPIQAVAQQPIQAVAQQQQPVAQQQTIQQAVSVPQAGLTAQQEGQIKALIGNSLEDHQIAAVIDGASVEAIKAVRLQVAAAGASPGF